jgi:hypothetical protein
MPPSQIARTLFTSHVLAVAKARRLSKTGWQVHIVDADSRVFHPVRPSSGGGGYSAASSRETIPCSDGTS